MGHCKDQFATNGRKEINQKDSGMNKEEFAANQQFGRLTRLKLKIPPRLHNLCGIAQQLQWGEIKKEPQQ